MYSDRMFFYIVADGQPTYTPTINRLMSLQGIIKPKPIYMGTTNDDCLVFGGRAESKTFVNADGNVVSMREQDIWHTVNTLRNKVDVWTRFAFGADTGGAYYSPLNPSYGFDYWLRPSSFGRYMQSQNEQLEQFLSDSVPAPTHRRGGAIILPLRIVDPT
jgi:hypothetical protein